MMSYLKGPKHLGANIKVMDDIRAHMNDYADKDLVKMLWKLQEL